MARFEILKDKTLTKVEVSPDNDEINFYTSDGGHYRMWHSQDCCESVTIDDVTGDWADVIGSPLLLAEMSTSENENPPGLSKEWQDSFTWTFYKLGTAKGYVDLRWYGESNGYYSESVSFMDMNDDRDWGWV